MDKEQIIEQIKKLSISDIQSIVKTLTDTVRERTAINSPSDVYEGHLRKYANKKQEHFVVLQLNGANQVTRCQTITIGLLNSSQVHPREVFSDAIRNRCSGIIIAHNHPSRNSDPSTEDITVTRRIIEAGSILGINVLDHIIISKSGYLSFKDKGLM